MARNYRRVRPIQQFDPTSCWAACLEWWARAIGNRQVITELNLLTTYVRRWDSRETLPNGNPNPDYGTVSRRNLMAILRDSRWRMTVEAIRGSSFTCHHANRRMKKGPIIVGYRKPGVGNHVVVVYGASNTHIACMDPDGGRFRGRLAAHYQNSEVIIGYPS